MLKLSQRWVKPALVAACVLVTFTVAWQSVPQNSPPPSPAVVSTHVELKSPPPATSLESTKIPAIEDSLAYHPVVDQPTASSRIVGDAETETEQEMVPTGLFITLSGPEQEAMLDLIEDAKLQQPSVSF